MTIVRGPLYRPKYPELPYMALTHSIPPSPTTSDGDPEVPFLPTNTHCGKCFDLEVDQRSVADRRTRRLEGLVFLLAGLLAVRTLIDIRQVFWPVQQPTATATGDSGRIVTPIPECAFSSGLQNKRL